MSAESDLRALLADIGLSGTKEWPEYAAEHVAHNAHLWLALLDAAQAAHSELDDAIKAAVNQDWGQDDYDGWDAARTALADAVRRLTQEHG